MKKIRLTQDVNSKGSIIPSGTILVPEILCSDGVVVDNCFIGYEAFEFVDVEAGVEDILEEALRISSGDRQNAYGPPDQDFARTAKIWSALKGVEFEPREVALFMIALKLSRETHQRKRDNWVDIAGYARCGSKCK